MPVATARDEKTGREVREEASDDSILLLAPSPLQSQTDDRHRNTRRPTCDGVEDLFGKRRVDGVAVAGDGRHASAHAEVVSGALVKAQEQEEETTEWFLCVLMYIY